MTVWLLIMMISTSSGELAMWDQGVYASKDDCFDMAEAAERTNGEFSYMCVPRVVK